MPAAARTWSSAASSALGSLPPATARSGLLPPPPLTVLAASAMSSHASKPLSGATADDQRDAATVGRTAEHDGADAGLVAHREREIAQRRHDRARRRARPRRRRPRSAASSSARPDASCRLSALISSRSSLISALPFDGVDELVGGDAERARRLARSVLPRRAVVRWGRSRRCASSRRRFEPIEPSETIFTGPMSPSARTWVPPHSSVECGPASSTRTMSPYLSPKKAMAPICSA